MKKLAFFICTMLTFSMLFGQSNSDFSTKWSNAFKVESVDKNFKLKFGGRLMMDWSFISQDDDLEAAFGESSNGFEFRRARFFNSGLIYNAVKYKVQLEFSGGELSFKDMYLEIPNTPLGALRLGHFKEPFRLEALTSSKYMTFMERAPHLAFSPERNSGAMIHNEILSGVLGYQIGVFHNANSAGDDVAFDGTNYAARLTVKAVDNDDHSLHVGLGASIRKMKEDEYKVSARPEAHLATKYVSTGHN